MGNINLSMSCNCKKFESEDGNSDLCKCKHDYIAHLKIILDECAANEQPTQPSKPIKKDSMEDIYD